MSRILLLFALCLGVSTHAEAADFIIWMEGQAPEDKVLTRAARLAGVKEHLFFRDLAFPPQPDSDADDAAYAALKIAKDTGLQSWTEYDVELEMARNLSTALEQVTVVRDERDLETLVETLLFQGAAIYRSFNPVTFEDDSQAAALRFDQPGFAANLGWARAMGLAPERRITRSDVVDASTYMNLREVETAYKGLNTGTLDLAGLPHAETLVVNGKEQSVSPGDALELRPGRHYVHIQRDGVISGRQVLDIESGQTVSLPFFVAPSELELAKSQIVNGLTTGFPDTVKESVERIAKHRKGAIFVAALDPDGQPVVLPYARGAKLAQNRKGAFILFGGAGFGLTKSQILDEEALTSDKWIPTGLAQFGLEVSYSYFCVTAGLDASIPAGRSVRFGGPGGNTAEDDKETYVLPQPWVGVGSYILRPFDNRHTLLVAATTEYLFPAHMGFGGRVVWGLPFQSGNAWFRVTLGGSAAGNTLKNWRELKPYDGVGYTKIYLGLNGGGRF